MRDPVWPNLAGFSYHRPPFLSCLKAPSVRGAQLYEHVECHCCNVKHGSGPWRLAASQQWSDCTAVSIGQNGGWAPRSGSEGAREQILDGLADLHELSQTGGLRDESGSSKILEQGLVPPGMGRTPHAYWNTAEVCDASDLAQDV